MRQALCSAETKEQAVSGIVLGPLATLGKECLAGHTVQWPNTCGDFVLERWYKEYLISPLAKAIQPCCSPLFLAGIGEKQDHPGAAVIGDHSQH